MTITPDDIYNLLQQGESISVEMKKCSDTLPRSLWETYSAFANTLGYARPDIKELDDVKEVWLSLPLIGARNIDEGTSKEVSTVNSTEESKFGSKNYIEGQVSDGMWQEEGQVNYNKGQENKIKEQVKAQVKEQVNLSEKQKEVLIYLLDNPSSSLKACSEATGASAMSIRFTFKKVKAWLDIRHEGPDKTGKWCFEPVKK